MRLLADISGIGDALLGRNISASTGTELYQAQVRNASVALTDLMETFVSFTSDRDLKIKTTMTSKC